jgi:glycosyltransferase involved in cell wall biosynthesis
MRTPMRILLINYEYPPIGAGAGNATANIARALAALGHRPIVLTAAYDSLPARSDVDGVLVLRVAAKRARADRSNLFEMATYVASAGLALPGVIRTEKPDAAIVFFSMPCGPLGLLLRWLSGVPYVVSLRGGDVPGTEPGLKRVYLLLGPVRRLVLRKAAAVVANSEGLKSLCQATDDVEVAVIPNGVDTDFFRPPGAREDRPFTFLFVGRFQPQKNLPFLLQALAVLRRESTVQIRVVIVGDGPMTSQLMQQSVSYGLQEIVGWHGWCDKKKLLQHYQRADCFLNPSLYEGMPNTVLEAMASGLPVLASNVAGNDAIVTAGETGFLFELGNIEMFVAAMRCLLDDPALAFRMGEIARKRVLSDFSWRRVASEYLELLIERGVPA